MEDQPKPPTGPPKPPEPDLPYNHEVTHLSPLEEALFQGWTKANGIEDADAKDSFYDYRGMFKASKGAVHPPGSVEHFPDTFKQHGHETFNSNSQYSLGEPFDSLLVQLMLKGKNARRSVS